MKLFQSAGLKAYRIVLIFLAGVAAVSCTTLEREPFTSIQAAGAEVLTADVEVRFWADSDLAAERFFPQSAEGSKPTLLALSGGSQDGAFGAGFLAGWSKAGSRPEFTTVTGVSTGALSAPFAFLGPRYDEHLRRAYTAVDRDNIVRRRSLLEIPFATSLASTAPLKRLIAAYISEPVIEEIAAEHQRGRRLFVVTVNLDAKRAVVWDMGAIASSTAPDRTDLFRRVLLASASVPALMPPVLIEAAANGAKVREMHVDGGTRLPILIIPNSLLIQDRAPPGGAGMKIFALVNNRLNGRFDLVEPDLEEISWKAMELAAQSHTSAILQSAYFYADRHDLEYHVAYVGNDYDQDPDERFDPAYMKALYEYGRNQGLAEAWRQHLPGM